MFRRVLCRVVIVALAASMLPLLRGRVVSAAPQTRLSTPQLIDAAERAGRISAAKAFDLRVRALRNQALPAGFRSAVPWRGTVTLRKAQRYARSSGKDTAARRSILGLSPSVGACPGLGIRHSSTAPNCAVT